MQCQDLGGSCHIRGISSPAHCPVCLTSSIVCFPSSKRTIPLLDGSTPSQLMTLSLTRMKVKLNSLLKKALVKLNLNLIYTIKFVSLQIVKFVSRFSWQQDTELVEND